MSGDLDAVHNALKACGYSLAAEHGYWSLFKGKKYITHFAAGTYLAACEIALALLQEPSQ